MTREISREIDMSKIERLRLRYINISMIAFIKFHSLRPRGGQENGGESFSRTGERAPGMLLLTKQFHDSFECSPIVPFTLQKKLGPDPLKSGPDQFFVSVYTFNNQVWLMIEKCNGTHARNHRKARQAHMKMVRNEGAFTQRFRTARGPD